ncbi:MAG: ribbon-helix-helix protein, CopG family [Cyanobacteria bacterium J06638_20]
MHRPSIRLTEEGLNLLKENAEKAGVSMSEYIEQMVRRSKQPNQPGEQQA